MAPKKKTQKMALSDFFAETPTSGSWADEIDNLPSAPAKKDPLAGPRKGEAGYLDSMPDRGSRMDSFSGAPMGRDEVPVPDVPPFTSFVGNLTFETEEEELRGFFSAHSPISVRLVKDPTGKPKGFGYVEFGSKQNLQDALGKNMTSLAGRTIRVSVAEPPSNPRRDFAPSAAEEASQWRRSGPLPSREAAPAPRRGPSFAGGDSPSGGPPAPERDLDWGSARGARFTPAPPAQEFRRNSSGAGQGRDRDFGAGGAGGAGGGGQFSPGVADSTNQWRSNKPAAIAVEGRPGPRVGSGQSSPGLADSEQTWSRGSKLRTPVDTPQSGASPSASATPSVGGESPKIPAAPLERRKLNLAPRSQAQTGASASTESGSNSNSSSIFGSAKPIDTTAREAEVNAKRQEERKKAQEERARKQKEEDAKIQAEADARTKAINDARDQALKERSGGATGGGAGARRPSSQQPLRQNSHSNGGSGARPPAGPKGGRSSSNNQSQKTDDGFEVAKGSRRDREQPAPTKKDAPIRQGFSFAAAAGLVDETPSSEKDESDDKAAEGTEEVTKQISEVKV